MAVVPATELLLLRDSVSSQPQAVFRRGSSGVVRIFRPSCGTSKKFVPVKQQKSFGNNASRLTLDSSRQLASFSLASRRSSPSLLNFVRIRSFPVTAASASAGEKRTSLRQSFQANAATVTTESWIGSDEVVATTAAEEAMALARAAAKAARDAAAYAEAQALAESFQDFPTEQDLLRLERARLTEMAKSSVLSMESTDVLGDVVSTEQIHSLWKDLDFASSGSDSGATSGVVWETERMTDDSHAPDDGVDDGESIPIAVKSGRRRERILKRERALLKADQAAAAVPTVTKPKKAQATYDPQDPVRAYLREIGKSKLLTSSEEIELAEGIQDLLKMENVKKDLREQMGREPTLVEWAKAVGTERHSLESRIKSGQACKDKMVNSNLRLVVSIAKRYQGRGMTIQDLIQEGSMGLIRGAEKFDHTRGFKFSTYAHWWIRQAITRAIADQSRTIRLPVHVYELLSRVTKAKSMLAAEHGRAPRDEEVAEIVGLTVEKLKMVIKSAKSPKSMEFPVGKNNDTTLGEVVPDKDIDSPEDAISKRLLKQDLDTVLRTLSPRERDVLRLRYGLEDGRMRTLEEIGHVFKVTRERIRQIEAKALRKLRQPSRNSALREYLDL
ncbi:hypothetical protein R1sor_016174 [Riccia sorocarpa]|uniref:RNA polymerase sigma factor n=1 Tax=Riccia sorocarpa TaxID=122646 RepID=A0ABD3HE91_9MARC